MLKYAAADDDDYNNNNKWNTHSFSSTTLIHTTGFQKDFSIDRTFSYKALINWVSLLSVTNDIIFWIDISKKYIWHLRDTRYNEVRC